MRRTATLLLGVAAISAPGSAIAGDTVTYGYDELGRLVTTNVSGGPNSGVAAGVAFDPAGNRTNVTISGAAQMRSAARPVQASSAEQVVSKSPPIFVFND